MGAHKYNPTAIAAKNGELPPKKKSNLSKRQRDALMMAKINEITGAADIQRALYNGGRFYR